MMLQQAGGDNIGVLLVDQPPIRDDHHRYHGWTPLLVLWEVAVAEDHRMVGRQAETGEMVDDLPEDDTPGDQVPGQSPMA